MIRPNRAHTRVFPERNYRVWKEVGTHYSLDDGLEMVWSEVILVWKVWTMSWRWSDQRLVLSEKSDHWQIRAHLGLIRGDFERNWVWSWPLRAHLGLIRNVFERNGVWSGTISSALFFSFLLFFYLEMLSLPGGNNKAAFWAKTHLKSDSSAQKKGFHLIAKAGPLQRKLWSAGDHDVSYGKLSKLIHSVRNIH